MCRAEGARRAHPTPASEAGKVLMGLRPNGKYETEVLYYIPRILRLRTSKLPCGVPDTQLCCLAPDHLPELAPVEGGLLRGVYRAGCYYIHTGSLWGTRVAEERKFCTFRNSTQRVVLEPVLENEKKRERRAARIIAVHRVRTMWVAVV